MEEVHWCFGVVLQPLVLGALNVCLALWNQKITKVFWSVMFHRVSWSCVSTDHRGSYSRTTTQNTQHKQGVHQGREVEGFRLDKSVCRLKPYWAAFYLLKRRLKGETPQNKQPLKEAALKAWRSITKEECKSLVMSVGRRLHAVIASKGFTTKF